MREIDEFFRVLVARIDPDAVPLCEVVGSVDGARHGRAARGGHEVVVGPARWKRRAGGSVTGTVQRPSSWPRSRARRSSAAKNQLETSKKVRKLPATEQALRSGKLSGAKAEAIAAAAEVAPEAEDELLDGAEDAPLAEVREQCLRARAKDRDAAHARIRKARSFKEFTDAEGGWNVIARGTARSGRRVPCRARPDRRRDVQGRPGRGPARAVRGLRVRRVHRARPPRREPHDRPKTSRPPKPAPSRRRRPRTTRTKTKAKATPAGYLAIIRLDYTALRRGSVEGDEVCEIVGLGPIPVSVARELLGDAILKLVITKGVDVANVTHLGRSATVAQQVALWWQSPDCTGSGCTRTRRLENDHREDWAKTKHTRLDETDPLCDTTTTSRPTSAGHSSKAKDLDPWSRPTTPATPETDHHLTHDDPGRRESCG